MKVDNKSAEVERLKARGRELARDLDKKLNPEMTSPTDRAHRTAGFAMLLFEFGDTGDVTWISNANRGDMIKVVEQWLQHAKGARS